MISQRYYTFEIKATICSFFLHFMVDYQLAYLRSAATRLFGQTGKDNRGKLIRDNLGCKKRDAF